MIAKAFGTEELRKIMPFRNISEKQLQVIVPYIVRRTYKPKQFIFCEGEESIGLWFILEGRVKIIKQSINGRLQGMCLVNRGKCFGSCPLFDNETNPADAQALNEVTLAVIPREALQHLIYNDASLAKVLLDIYNDRVGLLAKLGESLATWPVGMRINDCLIAHSVRTEAHPVVRLTHEEVATLVGTAREVVTRHLSALENQNLIETQPSKITLFDIESLKANCLAQHGMS
ncbi:MAG: Crp/Fnr family transcriptional regulator [Anaerolineae bacterium]|nr:Crp/Fnr family transcriptional regulator [Anaerolineae bacterium]